MSRDGILWSDLAYVLFDTANNKWKEMGFVYNRHILKMSILSNKNTSIDNRFQIHMTGLNVEDLHYMDRVSPLQHFICGLGYVPKFILIIILKLPL